MVPRMVGFTLMLLSSATLELAYSAPPAHTVPSTRAALHSGEITAAIDRLSVLGSVLYVAAHPDDENTRLLTWLTRIRHLRAAYISLTRGEGGQNLVGTEQGELLGLIRTQELLAARRIDGAEQLFSRARDFGYSKTADETLKAWGKEIVLGDLVWAIRRMRPDVIVTRFNTEPPNHGHHTASALLAAQAFSAAADPSRFPEQLTYVDVWQAHRLIHNVSHWRFTPETDLSGFQSAEIGAYVPLLGTTVGELAARSRSMHKSQGFGVAAERGSIKEYFQPLAGEPGPKDAPFAGFDTTWSRVPGSTRVPPLLNALKRGFDPRAPEKSLPALEKLHRAVSSLSSTLKPRSTEALWVAHKLNEVESLLIACAGITVEARAGQLTAPVRAAPNGKAIPVTVAFNARQGGDVTWEAIRFPDGHVKLREPTAASVKPNVPTVISHDLTLPKREPTNAAAVFRLDDAPWDVLATELGEPERSEAALQVAMDLRVAGVAIVVRTPLLTAWVDPIDGELTTRVETATRHSARFNSPAVMIPNGEPVDVSVTVSSLGESGTAQVSLEVPAGWTASPAVIAVTLDGTPAPKAVVFRVSGTQDALSAGDGRMRVLIDDGSGAGPVAATGETTIAYPHIPALTVREPAVARLVPVTLAGKRGRIGLIAGPGDRVAESLEAVGYTVIELDAPQLEPAVLANLDAVVIGVRAFNHTPDLHGRLPSLLTWVESGGRLIVQYMTNSRLAPLKGPIGPYPFTVAQGRVTDETATMTPKDAAHPALTSPNALTPGDFEGWVQERGLYYASEWDPKYSAIFSSADPGEPPQDGGLLVARHGRGVYVYTGLAFFRQLPAGVPGAFRLFQNLLSLPVDVP